MEGTFPHLGVGFRLCSHSDIEDIMSSICPALLSKCSGDRVQSVPVCLGLSQFVLSFWCDL